MRLLALGMAAATLAIVASSASSARADLVIKNPNAHPDYRVELEPHLDLGLIRYGGAGYRYTADGYLANPEFGGGFRASIEVADPAFIPKLNNTVAVTFGIDVTNCHYCTVHDFRIWNPIGMQWNFFLTEKFSVFADLGFLIRTDGFYSTVYGDFFAMLGGRFHFSQKAALTMRIGYPFVSVGVSFLAG